MTDVRFRYGFHPVGQGLFASGAIGHADDVLPSFHWVYDCGTSSRGQLVTHSINHLKGQVLPIQRLDFVTISHFDEDHVSGIVSLLRAFSTKVLLLPYLPLWQRLAIAFSERPGLPPDFMRFFVNPVSYIIEQLGDEPRSRVQEIVFVPASDGEGPPDPIQGTPSRHSKHEDSRPQTPIEEIGPNQEEFEDLRSFQEAGRLKGIQVSLLGRGAAIPATPTWEFVPYNDAHLAPKVPDVFRADAIRQRQVLLQGPTDKDRKDALEDLRATYDLHFGASHKRRNLISLFLYGGPTFNPHHAAYTGKTWCLGQPPTALPHLRWQQVNGDGSRCGVLYTGDGYLNTPDRFGRLRRYLGPRRVARSAVLQVMHHGARGTWHKGLASKLAPDLSIFSCEPSRYGHPHGPVLRDFWRFLPLRVDSHIGVTVEGRTVTW